MNIMFHRSNVTFLFLCLLLSGCATPYQPMGFRGGYSDSQLQNDQFQVSFLGNAKLTQAKARQYALRRAAEVALSNGFDYFIVEENQDISHAFVSGSNGNVSGGSKPEAILSIRCGNGTKPQNINSYDARELLQYATPKRLLREPHVVDWVDNK